MDLKFKRKYEKKAFHHACLVRSGLQNETLTNVYVMEDTVEKKNIPGKEAPREITVDLRGMERCKPSDKTQVT